MPLMDCEMQTGISLAKHSLAEQLQGCDSVESVTAVFCEQIRAFKEFQGNDKVEATQSGRIRST